MRFLWENQLEQVGSEAQGVWSNRIQKAKGDK